MQGEATGMAADRRDIDAMVAEFLARGRRINKIPAAQPTTANDVLHYLNEQGVKVEVAAVSLGYGHAKYMLDGAIIDLKTLLRQANARRRKQRLPPFELKR
jgi:hypothetical protein